MRKILTSLMIIAVVAVSITAAAMAVFTDQRTNPDNAFTTGTVILGIDPATAMFTVSDMAPGDVVYDGLEVSNDGSLELRYAMTTTADDTSTLDEQLDLTIDAVTGPGVDGIWYTADDVVGAANIYGPDDELSSAFFGDPVLGEQAGDRTLASSASERLRFKATLPLDTDDSYQGTTCTVAFVFDAEQTANNP
jgi:spore coat-associated protein N